MSHSQFGGSSAARWMHCPGSVSLCETVPEKPASKYAEEGTRAHELAAVCLASNDHPSTHTDDQDMIDAVVVYLNAVTHEQAQTKTAELYVEKGFVLPISTAEPGEVFGTNDALVWHPETGRLRVFDYKHGAGVSVDVEDNAQLKFYAAGACFSNPDWKVKQVVLTIVQPRDRSEDSVRDWKFEVADLLEFVAEVERAIWEAGFGIKSDRTAKLKTGPYCRWCPASAVCPQREAEAIAATTLDFKDVTQVTPDELPIVSNLDAERLGAVLKGLAILNDWYATVQEYVEGLLMSGQPVPGWKVVEKLGRSKWIADETAVAEYADMLFGIELDQIRPRRLTTIGDAEKILKAAGAMKTEIETFKSKFTIKESSGLTIAPETDRRPGVNAVKADFEGVQT
jgi:Protein of unknown function (DUF2800)